MLAPPTLVLPQMVVTSNAIDLGALAYFVSVRLSSGSVRTSQQHLLKIWDLPYVAGMDNCVRFLLGMRCVVVAEPTRA
jgi:hypothetical protein